MINVADTLFLEALALFIAQHHMPLDTHTYIEKNIYEELLLHKHTIYQLVVWYLHPELLDIQAFNKYSADFEKQSPTCHIVVHIIRSIMKTNLFDPEKQALSFHLSPLYLQECTLPISETISNNPFAIIYIYSPEFFGFHIRMQDLARGGLRTLYFLDPQVRMREKYHVFLECYELAYTQHRKNKDIPEGGAKAVLFLSEIHAQTKTKQEEIAEIQKIFINELLSLVIFDKEEKLIHPYIYDRLGTPERIFLGPDENMSEQMIDWIAKQSEERGYAVAKAFMSGKTQAGINHKEFGVTSVGIHACIEKALESLGIHPRKDTFTVKMSGGPDGDVAGNQIKNFYTYCRETAKILAIVDGSGTLYDPEGLVFDELIRLFNQKKTVEFYKRHYLHNGSFFLSSSLSSNNESVLMQKNQNTYIEKKIAPQEAVFFKKFMHRLPTTLFVPAGGRPGTLNEGTISDFLDASARPTARAIVEGANLYLTPYARRFLEDRGVLIIKDSSANKGGVICSSFEVQLLLVLTDEEFIMYKKELVEEIYIKISEAVTKEVEWLIIMHDETKKRYSDLAEYLSDEINHLSEMLIEIIRNKLQDVDLPLLPLLFRATLPFFSKFPYMKERFLQKMPYTHQVAILAKYLASTIIYSRHTLERLSAEEVWAFVLKLAV